MIELYRSTESGTGALRDRFDARVLSAYEDIRCRYIFQMFDAVLTAELGTSFFARSVAPLVDAGSASYKRLQRLINSVAMLLPWSVDRFRQELFDPTQLPLASRGVRLLSFGSGVTVFYVPTEHPRRQSEASVLKVFRKSLGRRRDVLLQLAQERRAEYEKVASWYHDCSVVLPTRFIVLHGPLLSRPAVACLQPYVEGKQTDLFKDLSEPDLIRLLGEHPKLREQLVRFVERTLHTAETEGVCVDLVGRNNLVVTGKGAERRLVLLDYGVYHFERKAIRSPKALADLRNRLAYLRRVCDQVNSKQKD